MRKLLIGFLLLGAAALAAFWLVTRPDTIPTSALPDYDGDPEKGATVFYASGCAGCHAAPGAKGDDKLVLAGGIAFKTPFGLFHAPNISSDRRHGIGEWTQAEFVNAMMRGVAPDGSHYYPVFPYLSYQRMTVEDVLDLKAFMDTLPAVATEAPPHDLPLPYRWRRTLGVWKALYMDGAPFAPIPGASASVNRGAYLVTGPGHCGECHTPRDILGGPEFAWAFSGAPDIDGEGTVPNITPHQDGIADWSVEDITAALKTGILPDFDTFGGTMIAVQENMARLSDADRRAIADYLKALPPKPSRWKKAPPGSS